MRQSGWLSHPLAAMKLGWPHRGQHLGRALRATSTFSAFDSGQVAPPFDEASAVPATLTYRDRNGKIVDDVFINQAAGLMLHVHSKDGDKTLAYLEDVPSQHITVGVASARDFQEHPESLLIEGRQSTVTLTVYERSLEARKRCIECHGSSCFACGFSFADTYGPKFAGYIHVHHLTPISTQGAEYQIDPKEELRPVCPNCHVIIHSRQPPLDIAELKFLLDRRGNI